MLTEYVVQWMHGSTLPFVFIIPHCVFQRRILKHTLWNSGICYAITGSPTMAVTLWMLKLIGIFIFTSVRSVFRRGCSSISYIFNQCFPADNTLLLWNFHRGIRRKNKRICSRGGDTNFSGLFVFLSMTLRNIFISVKASDLQIL